MRSANEGYKKGENPFIRIMVHTLHHESKHPLDYMKGPRRLLKEMETASRESKSTEWTAYGHQEFAPQENSRYDTLLSLLKEFEEFPSYANARSVTNCIEFVSRDVIMDILIALNGQMGMAKGKSNTEAILAMAAGSLFDSENSEERVSYKLNNVIEKFDVQDAYETIYEDAMKRMREIFEIQLTEQF